MRGLIPRTLGIGFQIETPYQQKCKRTRGIGPTKSIMLRLVKISWEEQTLAGSAIAIYRR